MTKPESLALRFQFETPEQQRATAEIGMWFFLSTEVLMFGALFTAWSVYRMWYSEAFSIASNRMDVTLGTANTVVLLTSSLMMAFAVLSAEAGRRLRSAVFLVGTMVLGAAFLGVKMYEYWHHYHQGDMPGFNWTYEGPMSPHVQMFFVFYFVMTGLHAIHMIVGLGILGVLTLRSLGSSFSSEYYTPVEIAGLYWHFVDIVWVFLFPLFYLSGRHLH